MEYQDNKLFDCDSKKYLFSESDWNKTLDDMIRDSYLLHPTNVIFNLNCCQVDNKPTLESEFVNINLNETERDQSLQTSQNSFLILKKANAITKIRKANNRKNWPK